jgi:NAD-dependent DNA ligase (contains BRCT domain type II)
LDVVSTGCRHKHVYSAEDAAAWLQVLHRWWSKPWAQHKGLKVFDHSKDLSLLPGMSEEEAQIARTAATLPGIGFDRACSVASHFGSIEAFLGAGVADWQRVPGIGKVIAQTVVGTIRRKIDKRRD